NWNGVSRALTYWWGQQMIKRIGGPWWYYVPQLLLYEPLLFFAIFAVVLGPLLRDPPRRGRGRYAYYGAGLALAGFFVALYQWPHQAPAVLLLAIGLAVLALATRWVPNRFIRFAILWALGSLAIYAWAQEKVPWLLV